MKHASLAFLAAVTTCAQVAAAEPAVPEAKVVASVAGGMGGLVRRIFDPETGVVCYFLGGTPSCVKVAEPVKKLN